MSVERLDLAVIGGGINGCAIARDAAGRGLRVLLLEQGDLASGTSSATSKLIHGGLRYLEQGEWRMVREALRERALLLRSLPHLVRPLELVLPHDASLRPRWQLRLGLLLYDWIGGARALPAARALRLDREPAGAPLRAHCRRGFALHDGWTDDARLVLTLAQEAAALGARIAPRTAFLTARPVAGAWQVQVQDREPESGAPRGPVRVVLARALVNAAGPWVADVASRVAAAPPAAKVRLVQGSHLVFRRWYEGDHGYLLQAEDRRVVFVLPWHAGHLLVGTTDTPLAGAPQSARVTDEEIQYLCRTLARWFRNPPQAGEAVDSFVGVRPLFDDGSPDPARISRDRRLERVRHPLGPAILHVFGGKLTTHRALAAEALELLRGDVLGMGPPWTHRKDARGAPGRSAAAIASALLEQIPDLPAGDARALAERQGEQALAIARDARCAADLGEDYGAGLREAELVHAVRREWARCADDLLLRRTRCGFLLSPAAQARVAARIREELSNVPENR